MSADNLFDSRGRNLRRQPPIDGPFSTVLRPPSGAAGLCRRSPVYLLSGRGPRSPGSAVLTSAVRPSPSGFVGSAPSTTTGDEIRAPAETCNRNADRLCRRGRINPLHCRCLARTPSPICYRAVAEFALPTRTWTPMPPRLQEIHPESPEASRLIEDNATLARADAGHRPGLRPWIWRNGGRYATKSGLCRNSSNRIPACPRL